ncbi:MAG: putative spermidine/putrescine transport system substrate-binding protein [Chloroflexota bacterium]|nr:putative spermidine/putrescine transport system substrate-binding protein [Chloroflexota bacterium]
MISTRSIRTISVLVLATLLLAACGGSSPAASASDWSNATTAEDSGGMDALVAAAQAEGELNVIALPEDWCNYGQMITTFEDKYGIQVNSITPEAGSADEVQAIIDNKENKGPQAPDVIDVGPAYGPSSKDQDLLAPYKVATWDSMTGVKDADGYYYTDYNGVLVFEINTDVVTDIPQDYADLLDPKYNGQVALAGDPRASNQAAQTVYAAALANGGSLDDIQPGLEYFKALNENGNLLPLIANTGSIAMGETPITFQWNYLALANADSFAGNPPVEIVYPASVSWGGYYLQAVSAYAPHPAAARLWQEFLYSDEGQTIWMEGYCAPSRLADMLERGVVSDELKAKLPDPAIIENAIVPDGDQLSAARDLIKEQWDSVVGLDIAE